MASEEKGKAFNDSDQSNDVKMDDPLNKNNILNKHPIEKYDKGHLESLSHFPEPMRDFFLMQDELGKIFALSLALKLEIFPKLATLGNNRSAKVLKDELKIKMSDRHFCDFLDQLYAHGYLDREGILEDALYKCSNYTTKYLLGEEDSSYGGVFKTIYPSLAQFSEYENYIKSGKEMLYTDKIFKSECATKSYADFYCKSNELNFKNLINNVDFSRFKRVIDIHGVTGYLPYAIKRAFPSCEVISYDYKGFATLCEEKKKAYEIQGEIKYEFGDILKDKVPECDCIVAPFTFMNYSKEHRKLILKMVLEQLQDGGTFIVMENLVEEERNRDSCGLKHSFCLALHGMEGYAKSLEEWTHCFNKYGFKDLQHIEKTGYADILICRK